MLKEFALFKAGKGLNKTEVSPVLHALKVEIKSEALEEFIKTLSVPFDGIRANGDMIDELNYKHEK